MKSVTAAILSPLLAIGLLAGCAQAPKPKALATLESLRAKGPPAGMNQAARQLFAQSETFYRQANEAWLDNELEDASHLAQVAHATLLRARSKAAQNRATMELQRLKREIAMAQKQQKGLKAQHARTEELIALHEELAVARTNTREKAMHLSEVQQAATARNRISEAALALKMAETVEAKKHAKRIYLAAKVMVVQAEKKLKADKSKKAAAIAALAKQKAELAFTKARPLFLRDKAVASRRAKNLSFQRELAQVAAKHKGVSVRLLPDEQGAKLEVRVTFLFPKAKSNPHPQKREILHQLSVVLKKYSEHPVMITGYTSHRTPRKKRQALSVARAEVVKESFIRQGLAASRFVANGDGAMKLIGYKFNGINDRVELLIPLSAVHPTSAPAKKEGKPKGKVSWETS